MRSLFSIILFFTFTVITNAQVDVSIHMHQKLGDQPFGYNTVVQTAAGYFVKVTRLQYYISEVKLIHDGGQITPVTDQYFLVAPNADSILELGNFDITLLEGIEYSLGVDAGHNHLDPASYPSSHPLAPKNPSMHWGWTSGYRFIAFEGFGGATSGAVNNNFQIHTIDDSNYQTVSMNTSGELTEGHLAIHVTADYLRMFDGINAQNGIISHTSNGASKKQMDNMLRLSYDLSKFNFSELVLSDLTGRTISRRFIPASTNDFTLEMDVPNGAYIINVVSDGKVVVAKKVSVQN